MAKYKIIIFKKPRIYCEGDDYIEYDEDEVKAICDYDDRWEAIDKLLENDADYKEHKEKDLSMIIDRDGFIRSRYFYNWWGYCLKESSIEYL